MSPGLNINQSASHSLELICKEQLFRNDNDTVTVRYKSLNYFLPEVICICRIICQQRDLHN